MITIVPAILEKKFAEIKKKVKRIERETPSLKWVQIDVADGKFVPNTTWSCASDLSKLNTKLNMEMHLMIENPERHLDQWLKQDLVKRVLVHQEAIVKPKEKITKELENKFFDIVARIKKSRRQSGLVINPGTSIKLIQKYLIVVDMVMVMGVEPGYSGQPFKSRVLRKINQLRHLAPRLPISVDGGVNLESAPRLVAVGATHLCASSYLWNSDDFAGAVWEMRGVVAGK